MAPFAAGLWLLLTATVLTWYLIGQQDADVGDGVALDYTIRPWALPYGVEHAIGIASILGFVGVLVVAWRSWRRGSMDPRWWTVLVLCSLAGAGIGAGWRVLTAGVIGANIGAGLIVLLGVPLLIIVVLVAVIRSITLIMRPTLFH
ncbi:hypothetical protein GCM10023318_48530 [Nocardia callitridis]|uniref:DUF2567 domain-containing protein n=1 Tax=Nocardia callitridis TaxID=648753 RepID=A0ABP9KTG2_9NOCA